jgi:hypothetical protein
MRWNSFSTTPRLGQLLAEQPDRFGIRHPILKREAQEPDERQPISYSVWSSESV